MTSPFKKVSPEHRSPMRFNVGEQCTSVRLSSDGKEHQMYVFFETSKNLEYSQWLQLGTIQDTPSVNGMYNFIVYKRKDETYDIVFAQQKLPNEMASKHFYMRTYIEEEGLSIDNKIYLAGELFRSGSSENPYYMVNLQSGTYTKGYKQKWLDRPESMASIGVRDEYDLERKLFERIKPLLQKKLNQEEKDIQYVPESLLTNYVVDFYPDVYYKLQELGIGSFFFENSIGCQLYKIKLTLDRLGSRGLTLMAVRKVKPYIEFKNRLPQAIKPEFEELIQPISLDEIMREYSTKGGRRARHSRRRQRRNHKTRVKRRIKRKASKKR